MCGEGQKPISHNADHYPSRERSGRHLRQSTTDQMRIDPRNSLHESVPSVPQEFEVRATKIYPSRYCRNHSKKSDVVGYVIDDGHHFLAPQNTSFPGNPALLKAAPPSLTEPPYSAMAVRASMAPVRRFCSPSGLPIPWLTVGARAGSLAGMPKVNLS
jgi:hypothetical protein